MLHCAGALGFGFWENGGGKDCCGGVGKGAGASFVIGGRFGSKGYILVLLAAVGI